MSYTVERCCWRLVVGGGGVRLQYDESWVTHFSAAVALGGTTHGMDSPGICQAGVEGSSAMNNLHEARSLCFRLVYRLRSVYGLGARE